MLISRRSHDATRIDHDAKVGSVVITTIDRGLESLLRTSLPLPDDLGDVSFDAPERSWGAQLSRVTVNLFLFDIARSTLPPLPQQERTSSERPRSSVGRRCRWCA